MTRYGHSFREDVKVRVGQEVKAGDVIALVGCNGDSTGHLEVRIGSIYNPNQAIAVDSRTLCSGNIDPPEGGFFSFLKMEDFLG